MSRMKPCTNPPLADDMLTCLPCWNDPQVTRFYSCPMRHRLCEFHFRKHACEEGIFVEAINAVTSGLTIIPEAISMEALNAMEGNTRNSLLMGYAFTVIVQPFEIFRRLEERNYPDFAGDSCFKSIINDLTKQGALSHQIRFAINHSQIYFVPYSLDVILKNVFNGQLHFYSKTTLPVLMESLSTYGNALKEHLTVLVRRFPQLPTGNATAARAATGPAQFGGGARFSNQPQQQAPSQGQASNVFLNQHHHF